MDLSQRTEFCQQLLYFFWQFCFSLRTSYKELICCTNIPNADIFTFCKHWCFIWRCFSLWVSLTTKPKLQNPPPRISTYILPHTIDQSITSKYAMVSPSHSNETDLSKWCWFTTGFDGIRIVVDRSNDQKFRQ